jgi:hypothetical protein
MNTCRPFPNLFCSLGISLLGQHIFIPCSHFAPYVALTRAPPSSARCLRNFRLSSSFVPLLLFALPVQYSCSLFLFTFPVRSFCSLFPFAHPVHSSRSLFLFTLPVRSSCSLFPFALPVQYCRSLFLFTLPVRSSCSLLPFHPSRSLSLFVRTPF